MTRRVSSLGKLLAPWCKVGVHGGVRVTDLRLDHRECTPGSVFFALDGSREHGLRYAQAAVANGAVAVVHDPQGADGIELPADVPCIALPDLRMLLGFIAARFFGEPAQRLNIIGVTGTNGKTSTVHLLAQAISLLGERCASLGTLGGGLWPKLEAGTRTTPDAIGIQRFFARMVELGARWIAMEVSSHALEQGRVQAVPFDIAVFTNLSRDHLDYHGSMEAYLAAKARLFSWPTLHTAVINVDDPAGQQLLAALDPQVDAVVCATELSPTITSRDYELMLAQHLQCTGSGLSFELVNDYIEQALPAQEPCEAVPLSSPLLGRFNVANLLAVAGVLAAMGFITRTTVPVLRQLQPVPGRMNVVSATGQPLVVVDYAHTPDALEQALVALRAHTTGQLGCVFGCGGDRDAGKRPLMGAAAARLSDWSIVTDDNPRSEDADHITAQILDGMGDAQVQVVHDRRSAIRSGITRLGANDALLIAGKGHESYQEVAGQLLPFDDSREARSMLLEQAA